MRVCALIFILLSPLLLSCGKGPVDLAGSGSESPNALTGTVLYSASSFDKAESTSVYLYEISETRLDSGKTDYTWALKDSIITNNTGDFKIDSMQPGYYSLIFQRHEKKAFSGYFRYLKEDSILNLGYIELKRTQTIQGIIRDTVNLQNKNRLVLGLVGTPYQDTTTAGGPFKFDSIPSGFFNFKVDDTDSTSTINTILASSNNYAASSAYFIISNPASDTISTSIKTGDALSIGVPWNIQPTIQTNSQDTTTLNVDSYQIEYTTIP